MIEPIERMRKLVNENLVMGLRFQMNGELNELEREIGQELNSRAERTCSIESSYLNDFTSNYECWYEFEMQCGYKFTWDEMEPPTYCPNCGCKVVSE